MNHALARKSGMNRGFTLIELLVVVAIIAVLAAILLPTLSAAKNRAQMVIDLNNVHQILMATHMYCHDNKDYLPRPGWAQGNLSNWCLGNPWGIAPAPGGTRGTYDSYYPLQVKGYLGFSSSGAPLAKQDAGQLSPYLKNVKLFRCPADVPNTLIYYRQVYITSYIWSMVVVGNAKSGWMVMNGVNTTIPLKLSQFSPSGILMWENNDLMASPTDPGYWVDVAGYPTPLEGISGRHGKGATVGRFSGSAERILMSDWVRMSSAPAGSPPNDCWCSPLTADGH